MNMRFLKTPIGNDEYVKVALDEKLRELKDWIKSISEMPHKMEAFTLLRQCLSQCRVIHLMRTLPPRQIESFLNEYDQILRHAFEELIGSRLETNWWWVAGLNSK